MISNKKCSVDKNDNVIKNGDSGSSINYKYSFFVREKFAKPLYSVQFNHYLGPTQPLIFATVGGNRAYAYECSNDGAIRLLHCYADPDINEMFYTCCWSRTQLFQTISPILIAAGLRGIIRIINTNIMECAHSFVGHTYAVNEVKINPIDSSLLLSASKDHTIRMWCITTKVCVAIFGGHEGHRDEVISVDFNRLGNCFVSASMDHSLRMWDLTKPELKRIIERSKAFGAGCGVLRFPTYKVHEADFKTRNIHSNYIDCVQWFGDFILSKCCGQKNAIVCWKPSKFKGTDGHMRASETIFHKFDIENCDCWYIRFNLNYDRTRMAIGNNCGQIYLWNLDNENPEDIVRITLSHWKLKSLIRQTSFSRNGDVLICVCDDGTIWRWDEKKSEK